MSDDTRQELDDAVMDWALGEQLGGEVPPDLAERVRERRAARPRIVAEPPPRARTLAAAAAILLGTSVVIALAISQFGRDRQNEANSGQNPGAPALVSSREEIEALPADSRHVIATGLRDDDVPALLRLRQLEVLQLSAVWPPHMAGGVSLRPQRTLTDDGLKMLAGMNHLRRLDLDYQVDIGGPGLEVLAHLPALEELALLISTADDDALAVLSRVPKLASVRFVSCTKVGRSTLERLADITTLRSLCLTSCCQLESHWLALLGKMPQLELLDLGMIGSHTRFSGLSPIDVPEPGSGVTDYVLHAMTGMKSLRRLNLSYGAVTGAGLRSIRDLPLLNLDLSGIEVPPEDLELLPPTLEVLWLRGSKVAYPDLGATLANVTPNMHTLNLGNCQSVNDDNLAGLRALAGLQSLDLSYCPNLTAAAIPELIKFEWLIALDLRGWKLDDEQLAKIRAMPNLGRLMTDAGSEMLR